MNGVAWREYESWVGKGVCAPDFFFLYIFRFNSFI